MCLCVSIYARYSVVLSIETVNSFARRHQFDAKDSKPFRLRKTNSFESSLFVFNFVSRTVVRMNNVKCGQMKIGFPFVRCMWVCVCVCKLSFLFFFFLFADFFLMSLKCTNKEKWWLGWYQFEWEIALRKYACQTFQCLNNNNPILNVRTIPL